MPKVLLLTWLFSIICLGAAIGIDVAKYLEENSESMVKAKGASFPPRGTIIMLASKEVDKWFNLQGQGIGEYAGWYICDGRNGAPDLTGRFVVGRDVMNKNSDYGTLGATGGAAHVTLTTNELPAHSHSFSGATAAAGHHTHPYYDVWNPDQYYWTGQWNYPCTDGPCEPVPPHRYVEYSSYNPVYDSSLGPQLSRVTNEAGSHSHSFEGTTGAIGSGKPLENRPPYYVVVYVIYAGI